MKSHFKPYHTAHIDLWRCWRAHNNLPPVRKYNPRVEAYVRDQMQDYYERLNDELGYSD